MFSTDQRLQKLEYRIAEAETALRMCAALTVSSLVNAVDQLVDERQISAATRTAILGRVRDDLKAVAIGNEAIAGAALRAIPHYNTVAERTEIKHRDARFRKELLQLRTESLDTDQSSDKPPAPPESD